MALGDRERARRDGTWWRGEAACARRAGWVGRARGASARCWRWPRWRSRWAGCESSQEKSAQLERAAKVERARNPAQASRGLSITQASREVQVVATQVVQSSEGTAAVVTSAQHLRARAARRADRGHREETPRGRRSTRTTPPAWKPRSPPCRCWRPARRSRGSTTRCRPRGTPTSVSALIGEAPRRPPSAPKIAVSGVHPNEEGGSSGAAGTVANESSRGAAEPRRLLRSPAAAGGSWRQAGRC